MNVAVHFTLVFSSLSFLRLLRPFTTVQVYGDGNEPVRPLDDDDEGLHTFPTDDWSGPQAQSGKTSRGKKTGPSDDDDDGSTSSSSSSSISSTRSTHPASGGPSGGSGPSGGKFGSSGGVMRQAGQEAGTHHQRRLEEDASSSRRSGKLGGVTKLAGDVYALPSLRPGQAYASSGGGGADGAPAVVVPMEALTEPYYEAISNLARASEHYHQYSTAALNHAGAPVERATTAFFETSASGSGDAREGTARDVTLHPALTAAATLSAFVVGLVATKVIG